MYVHSWGNRRRRLSLVSLINPVNLVTDIQKQPEGLTVQLMAVQMLCSGVAFATALMWAREVLFQTLSTSLPFPWLPTSIPFICFVIAAIALSFCGSAPISVLPTTPRVLVIRL